MPGAHRARASRLARVRGEARNAATPTAGEMRGSGPERCRRHISRSVLSPRPPPTAGLGCCVHAPHKFFGLFVRVGKGNRQEVHSAGQMPPKVQGKPQPTPAQVANPSPLRMTSPPAHPSLPPSATFFQGAAVHEVAPAPLSCSLIIHLCAKPVAFSLRPVPCRFVKYS
jgi:hypothetical protein